MKKEKDYIKDIAEIRSMMERSSKFLSLSGTAGILAGIYALLGAYVAHAYLEFTPEALHTDPAAALSFDLPQLLLLALFILVLAIGTAMYLSSRKAIKRGEKLWNPTGKRLVYSMGIPLITGGLLLLILLSQNLPGLLAPLSLIFYGLALCSASRYTYPDVKTMGLIQIGLGLLACIFMEYGLLLWALGFGVVHIIYGIYMHYRYEK